MSEGDRQRVRQWQEIVQEASHEKDPVKLKQLSQELGIALEERAKHLRERTLALDEQAEKMRDRILPILVPPANKKSA